MLSAWVLLIYKQVDDNIVFFRDSFYISLIALHNKLFQHMILHYISIFFHESSKYFTSFNYKYFFMLFTHRTFFMKKWKSTFICIKNINVHCLDTSLLTLKL